MINTTAYSFGAQNYPDAVEKVISIYEATAGIGCTIGPVLGSLTYEFIGFSWTFVTFGALIAPLCVLTPCYMRKSRKEP